MKLSNKILVVYVVAITLLALAFYLANNAASKRYEPYAEQLCRANEQDKIRVLEINGKNQSNILIDKQTTLGHTPFKLMQFSAVPTPDWVWLKGDTLHIELDRAGEITSRFNSFRIPALQKIIRNGVETKE